MNRRTLLLLSALVACAGNETPRPRPLPIPTASTTAALPPSDAGASSPPSPYPPTRRADVKDVVQGVEIVDPYRWLEDGKSDEVKAWARAQDDFTRARLAGLPERDAIAARLKELFYVESVSVPDKLHGRYFWSRREAKQEKWVVYWKDGKKGAEHVLLDPNAWSEDGSTSLGNWSVSWDGKTVAYGMKANNSDEAVMHVKDVATGADKSDVIEGAKYAQASWTPSGDGFYYTWLPPEGSVTPAERPGYAEVRFHKLGADAKTDTVIREKTGDAKSFISADLARGGRWLLVYVNHGWSRNDVYYADMRGKRFDQKPELKPLAVGQDAIFHVEPFEDRFYVHTNDGASRWRMYKVDPAHVERANWTEIVPERSDATLQGFSIVGRRLSLRYLKDVVTHVEVRDLDGKMVREVTLPGMGAASQLSGDELEDEAYYSYTSFGTPTEIYETSVKTGASSLWYKLKVPADTSKIEVEQLFATSKDGTRVPMFVVHQKDFKKDGTAPLILYGYGGFQSAETPRFRSSIIPWLERGGAYVFTNLRGGSEYGEAWHRAGMRHNKQNVFDDFIASAEHLIANKYTSAERLVIRGGSNGGLLVGAAMVERPDLFRVVLCAVPLLDMIRYHLFGSGKTWVEEYGSADDPEDFKALFAYSPYQHVKPGTKYPSLLMLSADADDRVDPMHARKFVAAMQAASTGGPVLLRVEHHSGHGGADLVKAEVEKGADEFAFALDQINAARN